MIRNWSVYMDQILEKWDEILMTVKTEHDISDIAFNTFLRPLEFYGVTGNTAYILVPSEQLGLSYISKKYLGNGSRYSEIYNSNKAVIGSNPNLIKPGQVLTIPG